MEQRKKPEQTQKGGDMRVWHQWTPRRETVAYRMWKRQKGVIPPGTRYIVRRIFTPKQYPSWTVIWYDPEMDVDVRASISSDLWKVLFYDWRPSKIIYYTVEQYSDGFLVREEPGKRYRKDDTGYVLEEDKPAQEEDEWDGGF